MTERKRRVVAIFTGSRADLGPLWPVINAFDGRDDVDLLVLMGGTHLSPEWSGTVSKMALRSGEVIPVEAHLTGTSAEALGRSFAATARGVNDVLAHRSVDCLVLLGDRWELLAVAGVALLHGVPIAHLHGGETTEGAIDERIRHSVTKLADLHLCATEDSARRLRQMGEEPWRIVVTGAPGLDRAVATKPMAPDRIQEVLGRAVVRPLGVVVYHPTTIQRRGVAANAAAVYRAAAAELGTAVILRPGADPGTEAVLESLTSSERVAQGNVVVLDGLGEEYLPLLASADVLVGNSSSGIIEAASLGLPVVNVGDRQAGRLRPPNVLDVADGDETAIRAALVESLKGEHPRGSARMANPYGDGASAPRIVEAIMSVRLDRLARKPLIEEPADLVRDGLPFVGEDATVRDVMQVIDSSGYQIALLVTGDATLVGTISDGDIRRALLAGSMLGEPAAPVANRVPVVLTQSDSQRPDAVLELMRRTGVSQIPAVDDDGRITGLHVLRRYLQGRASHPGDPSSSPG